jgi:hypothetical protein
LSVTAVQRSELAQARVAAIDFVMEGGLGCHFVVAGFVVGEDVGCRFLIWGGRARRKGAERGDRSARGD